MYRVSAAGEHAAAEAQAAVAEPRVTAHGRGRQTAFGTVT
jgi:hypothetical protein